EPEKFETDYYIFDDHFICDTLIAEGAKSPRATKQYKEWEQSEYRLIDDRKVINKPQFEIIKDMKDVLMKHFYCRTLLAKGEAEYSITGTLHTTDGDINIKGRPDYLKRDFHFIVDLKTTNDASLDMFSKSAAENDYHIQAALYSDLMELVTGDGMSWQFFFIAQEKRKPYAFNIFCAAPAFIQQGRYEYQQLLKLYKMCLDNNKWPGYQVFCEFKSGSIDLDLPKWAMKEIKFYNHK
ncbi:MAG: PD-(D/E)XK nuclease-like domain-containing protein, partial [Phycisphaerales bacterium]